MAIVNDFRGVWLNRFLRKWELVLTWVYSYTARVYGWLYGIEIGPQCRFMGMPLFRRIENSFIRIGRGCEFRSRGRWSGQVGLTRPCTIQTLRGGARLIIGNHCGFSSTAISAAEAIELGESVMCGANVIITDTDWHYAEPDRRRDPVPPSSPIVIGNNVWLGMNVIVLKGVSIGKNTVVAAGSIVTKDLPSNVIAAGQPAKIVRSLEKYTGK